MVKTMGVSTRAFAIEADRMLFVCDERGAADMRRVQLFVLQQKETLEFEWNQNKIKPSKRAIQQAQDAIDDSSRQSNKPRGKSIEDQLAAAGLPPDVKLPPQLSKIHEQQQQQQRDASPVPQHDET